MIFDRLSQPRTAGIACAILATGCGLFYLLAAGAPARYLVVNSVALLLGIVAFGGFAGAASRVRRVTSAALLLSGLLLLGTALFGGAVDGASRWIWIGPLSVQLSLVLLPFMILAFARHSDSVGLVSMANAALALALQPDRAMAGVLAFSLALLAATRPDRFSIVAGSAALAAFAVSLARPDVLPAVPYVDQIFYTAFDVHIMAGAAVLLGSTLLLVPAIIGWRRDPDHYHVHAVFGAIWLGCIVAALLGNYPTPVVGYGGSAILGYFLSLAFLPGRVASESSLERATGTHDSHPATGAHRIALSG